MFSFLLQKDIIDPVRYALDYYTKMQQALEDEKRKRKDSSSEVTKQNGHIDNITDSKQNGRRDSAPDSKQNSRQNSSNKVTLNT